MSTTEPTDEMVEAAARSMWELRRRPTDPEWGSGLDLGVREEYRKDARAALRAALAVAPDDYEAGYEEGFHHGRSTPAPPPSEDDWEVDAPHLLDPKEQNHE